MGEYGARHRFHSEPPASCWSFSAEYDNGIDKPGESPCTNHLPEESPSPSPRPVLNIQTSPDPGLPGPGGGSQPLPAQTTLSNTSPTSAENQRLGPLNGLLDGSCSTSSTPGRGAWGRHASSVRNVRDKPPSTPRLGGVRPGPPASFWSDPVISRRRQQQSLGGTPTKTPDVPRPSDRFIPDRDGGSSLADRFRTSKKPHQLSTHERLLRTEEAVPDAFCSRPRRPEPSTAGRKGTRSDGNERRTGEYGTTPHIYEDQRGQVPCLGLSLTMQ
jgi:hypothetical protein